MTVAPSRIWPEKEIKAGRTEDFTWAIYGPTESPLAIAADDKVRFKLSASRGGTPVLDLDNIAATSPGGSIVTVTTVGVNGTTPASGTVRLGQADTAALEGDYWGELSLVDNSETAPADAIKPICEGPIKIVPSQTGDIGIT